MKTVNYRIGIDLGGTKIEIMALDGLGKEMIRKRVPTPGDDYVAILQSIASLISHVESQHGVSDSIGICMPGALSPSTGRLKNSNTVCLNGNYFLNDIQGVIGRTVQIANDADCFTLSESVDGSAAGARVVFGVIIGTGVGGGIAVDCKLLKGPNAISGEWGHNPLPWLSDLERPGRLCYCGKYGCIETFLSGPGMVSDHLSRGGQYTSAEEIVLYGKANDPSCNYSLEIYTHRLARSLAQLINILDPDVIVLGGGMSNYRNLYADVPKIWGEFVFSDRVATRLLPPKYGDSSGVRGAAWLGG